MVTIGDATPAETPQPTARSREAQRLLDAVTDLCLERGISTLSLRDLSAGAGSNNRMLLYYFTTKEQLLVAALRNAASRFPLLQNALSALSEPGQDLADRLEAAWSAIAATQNEPFLRLFFEVVGLSAGDGERFGGFRAAVITEWSARVATALVKEGVPPAAAARLSDELVALWRGLQVALISGADRERLGVAYAQAATSFAERVRSHSVASRGGRGRQRRS